MSLRGDTRSHTLIARELGVRYILSGSVRKSGDRVRISVELLDEGARTPIWTQRFDGTLEDVFALQDTVANAVASQIEPSIQAAEVRRLQKAYFKQRTQTALKASMHAEHVLDILLTRWAEQKVTMKKEIYQQQHFTHEVTE